MKFTKGMKFHRVDWFTGGHMVYEVTDATKGMVFFMVYDREPDGECTQNEHRFIKTDAEGNEYCVLFEYHGEECRLCACDGVAA